MSDNDLKFDLKPEKVLKTAEEPKKDVIDITVKKPEKKKIETYKGEESLTRIGHENISFSNGTIEIDIREKKKPKKISRPVPKIIDMDQIAKKIGKFGTELIDEKNLISNANQIVDDILVMVEKSEKEQNFQLVCQLCGLAAQTYKILVAKLTPDRLDVKENYQLFSSFWRLKADLAKSQISEE